jgi:putative transposase
VCGAIVAVPSVTMSRPLRVLFPGAVYHVMSRGNERRRIYRDAADRLEFLDQLALAIERYGLLCHGYCLMGNHYHLLLETPRANLPIAMRHLNGCYTRSFNTRWHRVGHLFQGRYRAVLTEKDAHLLENVRYIALNPTRTEPPLCGQPEAWPWSSYRALLGLGPQPRWLTVGWVLAQLARDYGNARLRLKAFVDEGLTTQQQPLPGGIYFAAEEFIRDKTAGLKPIPEIPRSHWQPLRPTLEEIFTTASDPITSAYREYGYTLREIAEHLGCHYATVSRRLRKSERAA